MANTHWSTTDKTAGITLSGSNLIATTTLSNQGIRSADLQTTGKFYFEITLTTTFGQSNTGVGSTAAALNNPNALAICTVYHNNGGIFLNNVSTGVGFGASIPNGTIVCIAVDVTNQLIWFRLGAAGNWNNNATFSPGGTGGINISSVFGPGIPLYAYAFFATNGEAFTANFGDTAFTGTVPSGFTAGWTAGATASTNAIVTQAAVEEWVRPNPAAQVTQVAVEEWVAGNPQFQVTQVALEHWITNNPQFQVTQVAIEHWASVAATYPTPLAPTRMLSGSRAGSGSVAMFFDNASRTRMISGVGAVQQIATAVPTTSITLSGVFATGAVGSVVSTIPSAGGTLVGVAATAAFGLIGSTDIEPLVGVFAAGFAGAILIFPGPVAFPVGVYATGVPGTIFAIAGGIVEKFKFFMAGPF